MLDYISFDTLNNEERTVYSHFDNGRWNSYYTSSGKKLIDSVTIELDGAGKYKTVFVFDTSRKIASSIKNITENKLQRIESASEYGPAANLQSQVSYFFDSLFSLGYTMKDSLGKIIHQQIITLNEMHDPATELTRRFTGKDSTVTNKTFSYTKKDQAGN